MIKANKTILLTVLSCLFSFTALSQELGGFSTLDRYQQKARIGLVGEFMKRFNGTERHPDLPAKVKDSRKKNLMMLYNLSMFKSQKDKRFRDASAMMDLVIKDNTKIHYKDSTWCAKALCRGILNGKAVTFYLYLTVEPRGGNMYKWVIAKAEGKIFNAKAIRTPKTKPISGREIMLFPDDHETNFMSLTKLINDYSKDIEKIVRSDYSDGATASFVSLVYNKALKFNYVSKLEFIFEQIPNYEFTVAYSQKGKINLGWLISSFRKISNENKSAFLSSLYEKKKDDLVAITPAVISHPMQSTKKMFLDIAEPIFISSDEGSDSIEMSTCILSKATVKALHESDSVECLLLDPMSKDTIKVAKGNYEAFEILDSVKLRDDAMNALKSTLLYPESFVQKDYVKDCTFLPDIAFVFYKDGVKKLILSYSFYCDICKINSNGNPIQYDGELIRNSIMQITIEAFPNDRYMRKIAGLTR